MRDQLALYRLDEATLNRLPQMDFIEGAEVAQFLERKGRHVAELMYSGGSVGALLKGLRAITGVKLDGLVGQSGMAIDPAGPLTFCSRIERGDLEAMLGALSQARRACGKGQDRDPNVAQMAQRLDDLAGTLGAGGRLPSLIREVETFLEGARGMSGVVAAYTSW